MLIISEENHKLRGTKHQLPDKILKNCQNNILKYPQYRAKGGYKKCNHVLEVGGLVSMEWLKGMKSFFKKHTDTNDIDFILGGGTMMKVYVENKLDQLTASTPKTRKQHANSPVKPLTPADNLSGHRSEKSSEALSMVKSLMSGILNNSKQTEIKGKTIIITEQQLNELKKYINEEKQVAPNKFIYHTSNPIFRDKILKKGLIPKGESETWLSDTNIKGKVIFATNSDNKEDWFDSTYDDDIYKVDMESLKNKWYQDPNFKDNKYIITYESIPLKNIELIYKGTGK